MKKIVFMWIGLLSLSLNSYAADPVWLKGKTEQQYEITVYRSASCGCCKGWISHLKDHNFTVEDVVVNDVNSHKTRLGVPPKAASCHTAEVNGKVIEGHVPAQDIKRLLAVESDIQLLAVPGMPSGGPGMDTEGARKDSFTVFSMDSQNRVSSFSQYADY
ncbi:DUF411 domain-containing protein [Amphritea japonica]|uniref:CopG family transcriptional regulator n=1 Tax=Amphritea japonica ATCC BAA-1530 TaxID=1278309 RepID=A0A7R6P891_9GAMM|nr:DUF411 domain-containing protein [Amphritea japonica]BBB24668.1 CopG family transcriptional regulator [Amphritea japonica ATCC BAA-1530]